MKVTIFAALAAITALALPTASFAAAYNYVDSGGIVRTVEASSVTGAFSAANNISLHSGVALDNGVLESGDTVSAPGVPNTGGAGMYNYHYVTTGDMVQSVNASTPAAAIAAAVDMSAHSGVAIDRGILEDGVSVANQ